MNNLRAILGSLAAILLLIGWFASEYASVIVGNPSEYAAKVDHTSVRLIVVAFFALAVIFALIPEREAVET